MVSFENVFSLARLLSQIELTVFDIDTRTNFFFLNWVHLNIKKDQYEIILVLKPRFNELNRRIAIFNKLKNKCFSFLKSTDLEKVEFSKLEKIILAHKDYTDSGKKVAVLEKDRVFQPLEKSINSFLDSFKNVAILFGGSREFKTREKCIHRVRELIEIYSFGFFESTVLLCGRFLEELVTDYLKLLKHKKLIKYKLKEIDSWNFDTKINILHKEQKTTRLTESQFSKLSSIKWDRNTCAHPNTKNEREKIKNEVDAIIISTLNLMQEFEIKMYKLRTQK
jgi:hypothetical protein